MEAARFAADSRVSAHLAARDGAAIREAAAAAMGPGMVLAPEAVAALVARFHLESEEALCLHLLSLAEALAVPPVSRFYVGAVGLCAEGHVILGGNQEFPGSHLGMTLHGEGFVMIRAFHLGLRLKAIALNRARPCAHCRQCLSELAGAGELVLIDPEGHRVPLFDLCPWPFLPGDLGQAGAGAQPAWDLTLRGAAPEPVREALSARLAQAHAPYSRLPAALALETAAGIFCGAVIENVAFNPTIQPVMSAMVELVAAGQAAEDIRAAWLVQGPWQEGAPESGQGRRPVDYVASSRALLGAVAPGVELSLLEAVA